MWARPASRFGNYTMAHWWAYEEGREGFTTRCGAGIDMDYPLQLLLLDNGKQCKRCQKYLRADDAVR